MRAFYWLFSILVVGSTYTSQANTTLSTFDNQYSSKMYGLTVDVTSRLTSLADNQYELYFNADSLLGSITETSLLEWNAQQQTVIPHQYFYKRRGIGKKRTEALRFDWATKTINNDQNNTSLAMSVNGESAEKLQDSLSYQLQLRQDLMKGKKNFVYPISDGNKTKEYRFDIIAEETLNTPLGDVATVKVKRTFTSDKRTTYAWFAKDFQYLLVRLQQEENGSAYTIYISKASLNGKAIEHF